VARAFRVISTGTDLQLPEVDWELLDASELYDDESLAALRDQARTHGAVLALLADFEAELVPLVIMHVDAAWSILELDGEPHGFVVTSRGDGRFVALVSSSDHGGFGWPCARTGFVRRDDLAWLSDSWRILPHPRVVATGRPWCWRGARQSFGPHSLTIHCTASATEIDSFLAACAPMPYVRADATRYDAAPELGEDQRIEIRDGEVTWLRRCSEPREPLAAFDAGVLHAIAAGALGCIDWLAREHDWETPVALGDDGTSLADYLSGDQTTVDAEQTQRLAPHHLDAEALTPSELVGQLSLLLGAPSPIGANDFDTWLAQLTLGAGPRYVLIQVSGSPSELFARLWRCQRRIIWRVIGRS
jgi:hypothetical protein